MRIAILQGAFLPVPPIRGGAVEKMWFLLGQEFARKGHEVIHVSRLVDGLPETETIEAVHHQRVRGFDTPKSLAVLKFFDLLYTLRVRNRFHTHFDVIVCNTFWAPIVLPKRNKSVCMVDVQRGPKGQMKWYAGVSRYRANSTPVATAIQEEISVEQRRKVVMIPNPLPFVPTAKVDFSAKKPVILYVGRIHPEKGLELLINAFRQTDQSYTLKLVGPWDVAMGGGGEAYLAALKKLADGLSVEFIGPVFDTNQLNAFYTEAALFAYPSIAEKGETFGLAPLEAMAWGCVPVVSSLECFQDFIEDGLNGRIFNHRSEQAAETLAACLIDLQNDMEQQRTLSAKALDVRQSHSMQRIADLFLEEFQQMTTANQEQYVS